MRCFLPRGHDWFFQPDRPPRAWQPAEGPLLVKGEPVSLRGYKRFDNPHCPCKFADPPTVNGEPIKLKGYPLVDSAWAYSAFRSGEMVMRYGGEEREVWYNE